MRRSAEIPNIAGSVIFLFAMFASYPTNAQISPGKLSNPHAFLDGLSQCLKCHTLGAGMSKTKCLDCHKELDVRLKKQKGYHHTVVNVQGKSCESCHSEHAGRNFQLVHWPNGMQRFDHRLAGYILKGKHKALKCRQCHQPKFIVADLKKLQPKINLKKTFLGLGTACLSCHFDEHRRQLSRSCTRCHTENAWKPAVKFDHNRTRFRLTGKHRRVACGKCHPKVRDRRTRVKAKRFFVKYRGLAFQSCENCHRDAHDGQFGKNCKKCHQTSGWKRIRTGNFNHDLTRFPLRGKHTEVACIQCHKSGDMTRPLAFQRCDMCHRDEHEGQFAHRRDGGRCESCHTVQGFLPALFSRQDHSQTRFALTGAHLATPCVACHKMRRGFKGRQIRNFTFASTECHACHEDIHRGQFSKLKPVKACRECHFTTEWTELKFDHNRDSRFKLEGAHRQVACSDCHKRVRFKKWVFVLYRPINPGCKTCHGSKQMLLN
ncbi:MAG: cytochrome C [candidate division KSB1 bacterium]|nr:cytochrome C [candidate division KSB1 bacterium]